MFDRQRELFNIAFTILQTQYTNKLWSFGGGTALSACYWRHRNSTDIDIFLNDPNFDLNYFKPTPHNRELQKKIYNDLHILGFKDFYFTNNYFEYSFKDSSKIQFILSSPLTSDPFDAKEVFGYQNIIVEKPNEIIAKKLFYRAQEFKPRDIIDTAIAITLNKEILFELLQEKAIDLDMLDDYAEKLREFAAHKKNLKIIQDEVSAIGVLDKYTNIANNAIAIIKDGIDRTINEQILRDMQK